MNERKFINEAVKKLLVSEYIKKETENAGFGGMEMKRTPFGTNITLHVNKPGLVIGRHGSKVQAITENLEKKYKIESPQIEVKEIDNPDLNPQVVSKKIALSLEKGWAYRKAGNTSLRRIVESGARGVIISVSGKLSGERGRMQKFMSGSVKYSGEPARAGMERGFSVAKLKLGVIGVKVGILRSDYKLPDDYVVSEKLGVSTPQLIQEEEPAPAKSDSEQVKGKPDERQKGRPPQRGPRKTEEKKDKVEVRKPVPVEKKVEVKPEAAPAKPEVKAETEPEAKKAVKAEPQKVEAEPEPKKVAEKEVKVEAEPEAKAVKVEAKKEELKPETPKAPEETKEKPKAKKTTKSKEKEEKKPAAKKTTSKAAKKSEPNKEKKAEPVPKEKKKEEKVEEDGAKSKATETDEQ